MNVLESVVTSAKLPSLPTVAIKLIEFSKDPDVDMRKVIAVVRSDPAISAKILKVANSSYFGRRQEVTSVDSAVSRLGLTVVTSLALSFNLVDQSIRQGALEEHYRAYWLRSVIQAAAAELLGKIYSRNGDCFSAGLLMDLGQLALLRGAGDVYTQVLARAADQNVALVQLEREMLDCDHSQVGAELLRRWNLPEPFILAAQMHHAQSHELQGFADHPCYGLLRVAAVSSLAGEYLTHRGGAGTQMESLATACHQLMGMEDSGVQEFLENLHGRAVATGQVLSVDTTDLPDPQELMDAANAQLADIALRAQIEGAAAQARSQELERERQRLQEERDNLEDRATRDPLTEVFNRGFFIECLSKEVARCQRHVQPLGLLFVDVDRFKQINDTFGHAAGDQVLQAVARALCSCVRKSDVVARYGGEEFVILYSDVRMDSLEPSAERIREAVAGIQLAHDKTTIGVTASVGGAIGVPPQSAQLWDKQLLETADQAMYWCKNNGRNRSRVTVLSGGEAPGPAGIGARQALAGH